MIKSFNQFIIESKKEDFNTLGEYIEYLSNDDEYAQSLISDHLKDVDPTINVSNALNLLDNQTLTKIVNLIIKNKLKRGTKDFDVITHTENPILESNQLGGINLFNCFLKIITALGQKDISPNWEITPKDYLIFYVTDELDVEDIKSVSSRYKYFRNFLETFNQQSSRLFFGIRGDLTFVYGILNDNNGLPFGEFKITKSPFNKLKKLKSVSSFSLRQYLSNLTYNELVLIANIKKDFEQFNPGEYQDVSIPFVENDRITFGYYGVGRWDNGKIDYGEIESIKHKINSFLSGYRWSYMVQFKVYAENFWTYITIKIKK